MGKWDCTDSHVCQEIAANELSTRCWSAQITETFEDIDIFCLQRRRMINRNAIFVYLFPIMFCPPIFLQSVLLIGELGTM